MSQLKEFGKQTDLRLKVEEVMSPIIKNVEETVNLLLKKCQDLDVSNQKIKYVIGLCESLDLKIDERMLIISDSKARLEQLTRRFNLSEQTSLQLQQDHQDSLSKLECSILKVSKRIQDAIQNSDTNLNAQRKNTDRQQKNIDNLKAKFNILQKDMLDKANSIQSTAGRIQEEFREMQRLYDRERAQLNRLAGSITLYDNDKDFIRGKLRSLEQVSLTKASRDDFQLLKIKISSQFRGFQSSMKNLLQESLPAEVRSQLPYVKTVISDIKSIFQKLHSLDAQLSQHKGEIGEIKEFQLPGLSRLIQQKVLLQRNQRVDNVETCNAETRKLFNDRLDSIWETFKLQIANTKSSLSQRIEETDSCLREQLQRRLCGFIERNRKELYECIKESIPEEERKFYESLKQIKPEMDSIQIKIQDKARGIQNIANSLHETLQEFSGRITIVRSDVELKFGELLKQIHSLNRYRQSTKAQFQRNANFMAGVMESLNILLSVGLDSQVQLRQLRKETVAQQIFVNFKEGQIYEIVPTRTYFFYRKNRISRFDILRFTLHAFVKFQSQFMVSDQFLQSKQNWGVEFFLSRVKRGEEALQSRPIKILEKT